MQWFLFTYSLIGVHSFVFYKRQKIVKQETKVTKEQKMCGHAVASYKDGIFEVMANSLAARWSGVETVELANYSPELCFIFLRNIFS